VKLSSPSAVLALGGLDPTGRAGLLVDASAIEHHGGRPLAVATALTAQGETRFSVHPVPSSTIRVQLRALSEVFKVRAIKLGMIPNLEVLRAIRAELSGTRTPWVVDPVVRTSRGQPLSSLRPRDYLSLASSDVVLTPNAVEAGWLLGEKAPARRLEQALEFGSRLIRHGFRAVIVKGGHLSPGATDILCLRDAALVLPGERLPRSASRHRGTGCRFASTLAAELARGAGVAEAAEVAKRSVERFLRDGTAES